MDPFLERLSDVDVSLVFLRDENRAMWMQTDDLSKEEIPSSMFNLSSLHARDHERSRGIDRQQFIWFLSHMHACSFGLAVLRCIWLGHCAKACMHLCMVGVCMGWNNI